MSSKKISQLTAVATPLEDEDVLAVVDNSADETKKVSFNEASRKSISETITGISYDSDTGVLSLTAGYVIPTTTEESNWNTAYGWGYHASAGYFVKATDDLDDILAGTTNVHLTATLKGNYDDAYSHKTTEDAINGIVLVDGVGGYSAAVVGTDYDNYWSRAGATLSPRTANDDLDMGTGDISATLISAYDATLSKYARISHDGTSANLSTNSGDISILAPGTSDINLRLGDAIGVNKVSIQDSGNNEQASIDSDGNIDTVGRLSVYSGANYGQFYHDGSDSMLTSSAGDITLWTASDVNVLLSDAAGASYFRVQDSGVNTVLSVDSDGNLTATGTITGGTLTDGTFSVTAGAITGASGSNSQWTNDEGYLTSVAFGDLSDYPANAAGVLTNDGAGNLSWGTAGYTNLTSFVSQTAWRVFYSNADGDVTELALGGDGTYLKSNGAGAAPTWEAPAGGGSSVSFGADNQIPYTNSTTDDFDYSAGFTFDGTDLKLLADNSKLYFGAGSDASMYYNGTNLIINPRDVGTGGLVIGAGAAGVDYTLTFDGESDDGVITYDEDNNLFNLGDTGVTTTGNLIVRSDTGYIDLGATADDYKIQWDGSNAVHTTSSGGFLFSNGSEEAAMSYLGYGFYSNYDALFGGGVFYTDYNNSNVIVAANLKIPVDNFKFYLGEGDDASIYFDGSDMIINSENVTASDELHITNFDGVDLGSGFLTTTGLGTFGNLDVDTLNLNGNVISDSTGTISFDDDNLTTTGTGTFGTATISGGVSNDISIGKDTSIAGDNAIAIGHLAFADGESATAIGYDAYATGFYATALGGAGACGYGSLGLGYAFANGDYSISIGYYSVALNNNEIDISNADSTYGIVNSSSGYSQLNIYNGVANFAKNSITTTGTGRFDGGIGIDTDANSSYGVNIDMDGVTRGVNYTNTQNQDYFSSCGAYNDITASGGYAYGSGVSNYITASGSGAYGSGVSNDITVSGSNAYGYGAYNNIFSSGANTNQTLYGTYSYIEPHAAGVIAYGENIYSNTSTINNPTQNQIGLYIDWKIAGTDSSNKRWAIYNDSSNTTAGKVFLGKDNTKTYWGTGYDASTYFDGSDLIINSENVTASDELHITNFDAVVLGNYNFDTDQTVGAGQDNYVLTYDNSSGQISLEASAGGGDVSKVGTPVDNQIGVWTGDGTIEGTAGLTYDGANFHVTGDIGITGTRITKGWFTDLEVTNAITGSITGNAATVTNATFTTALTVNTGDLTLTANADDSSVLTIGSGAVSVSGSNTGDQVAGDFNHDDLANIPANDHIDWTISQAPTVIHADNYTNTTYSASDFNHDDLSNISGGAVGEYNHITDAELTVLQATSGTNTGDQTDMSAISDTKANFDTALSDGTFAFAGGAFHDGFSDYVANEHIDWTADQGATNIHAGNIPDLSGTYATLALDNLASVAINTSLISDTNNTDDLGSSDIKWKDIYYAGSLKTVDTTTSDTGIIYKGTAYFLHNFKHPTGNTAVPVGRNVFLGEGAGNLTMGSTATSVGQASNNAALGYKALYSNTTGYRNVAFGSMALNANTEGYENAAYGYSAMLVATTASRNTAFGVAALLTHTTADNNTAVGYASLFSNTTGEGNMGVGHAALYGNTTGARNIGIGRDSGRYLLDGSTANATGSQNIYIGYDTRSYAATQSNEIVIGSEARGEGSNTIRLGNSSITDVYTSGAIRIAYLGAAPASLTNGTIWMESDGLHIYYNGAEKVVAGV